MNNHPLQKGAAAAAALLLCLRLTLPVQAARSDEIWSYDTFETAAKGCIVMEAQTGRVLYGKNIHQQLPMASTTKIMTALLTLEQPELDTYFTVDPDAIQVEGSSMGLQPGDQVSLRTLVYGMLLPSGNDAANAAAVRIAGSLENFALLMNEKAGSLGLENTFFMNPSGLDEPCHCSTAYDMAKLTATALQDPFFRQVCCLSEAQVTFGNPPYRRWLKNHNKLLKLYEPCIGVKTGFTDAARRCLVSAAQKNGLTLICVTLNAADDWNLHINLYERYFGLLRTIPAEQLLPQGEVAVSGGESSTVSVQLPAPMDLPIKEEDLKQLHCRLSVEPMVFAPVQKGQLLGEATLYYNGKDFVHLPLVAARDVPKAPRESKSLIDRLRSFALQLF